MASKAARRTAGSAAKGRSMPWVQGMICGAVLTFATPAALLAVGLLAPALLALAADRRPGRPVLRAVLLYGCAVALAPLWHLCLSGDNMDTALVMVSDLATLATAWLAAAVGWALCEILPVVLQTATKYSESARVLTWETELKRIRDEWGED